jgi:glycosyltransferase involved in cell wall biosynthesis
LKSLKLAFELRKKILTLKPDIVHAQMPRGAWALGFMKKLGLIPKETKLVFTDRVHLESCRWLIKLISKSLIKNVYDRIICLTKISETYWRKKYGRAKTTTIHNFAGLKYEKYNYSLRIKIRKELNIDNQEFCVMFSGRMHKDKNWELAKEIVYQLNNENILFIFVIVTTSSKQKKELDDFHKEISEIGVRYRLFHNVQKDKMPDYYYLADIFVLTSNIESFGRTAIEAMSRKCAVIGRNVGGLPEVIGKSRNILKNNVKEFTERILYYKTHPKLLNKDKEWFLNRFREKFTVKNCIDNHCKLYEDLVQ